jgi:hypothetical protein
MNPRALLILFLALLSVSGCSTYTTPGAGVSMPQLRDGGEMAEFYQRQPEARFPAVVAVVRVQDRGYCSYTACAHGSGRFTVLNTRDIESEEDFQRVARLPMISALAALNRLVLPDTLDSLHDLRLAAATLKADMLLVYSLDTVFRIESTDLGPLSLISLGFLPNKEARVTTTASAMLTDVRSGYIYGLAEATALESKRATFWSSKDAIDSSRQNAEKKAFHLLTEEFMKLWQHVVNVYGVRPL